MPVSEQFRFITNTEAESLIVYVGNDAYTSGLATYANMYMLYGSRIDIDGILQGIITMNYYIQILMTHRSVILFQFLNCKFEREINTIAFILPYWYKKHNCVYSLVGIHINPNKINT
jgi:hypothetical protein